ncbi:MAG: ABC transporter permease [Burkholderiales bacterium]|nr:ABC transporter permease [Burkholderiales bacterium]
MKNWLRQHRFALSVAFNHLRSSPAGFAFNVLVVAIALALPIAGLTLLENVRPLSEQLAVEPEISLFLQLDLPREKALALGKPLQQMLASDNAKIQFIPREQALASLQNRGAMADVVATLGQNPLPDSYVLKLENYRNANAANKIDELAAQIKTLPGVDNVQVDSAWVKRLAALLAILRYGLLFLAVTLSVVVIVVVFNTVRLQVFTQLDEIEISKLIGATNAFIHRPFFYSGALLGAVAGCLALATVALLLPPFNGVIAQFAHLYASEFQLQPLGLVVSVALLCASTGLGLIGAWLSVRRHLARLA